MFSRRHLLRAAATTAALRFLAGGRATASPDPRPRLDQDPFALGVASGEPSRDGFVLWTRIMGVDRDTAPAFEIAEDEAFRRVVRAGRTLAPRGRAGAVHLEVKGLRPGRPYWYRFHLNNAVSRTGRVSTLAAEPTRLRLALTSCQHWEQGWFTAYRDMVGQGVDAVLQVGDYIYEKPFGHGATVRSFGAPVPRTLDEFRARHALYRTDPDLAAAHAAMPFILTWDDHEVENDYAGLKGGTTADAAAFAQLRAAACQAYFEHMPLRPASLHPDGELRLYRQFQWGSLASLHVLDTRQYRTPHPAPGQGGRIVDRSADALDPAASMLGRAQEEWLRAGLARNQARWTLVGQQTFFSRLVLPQDPEALYSDIWDGYAGTRDRTLAALSQPAVRNSVILGGDVHSFWANDVLRDFSRPDAAPVATEIITSCLASRPGPAALFDPAPRLNPHVRYRANGPAGYVLLDIRPDRLDVDMRAVADLTDPQSRVASLAAFTIEDGRPGIAR